MTKPGCLTKERYIRLQALNPLLAQGTYTMQELATRFGVNINVICGDRDYIYENWWKSEHREEVEDERARRIKELEYIKRLALESYFRSRQDHEETTTRYDKRICEECEGTGKLPKCTCINCEGLGYVMEEIITRKISGQAGDNAFLQTARAITLDVCKMQALFKNPEVKVQHVVSANVHHTVALEEKYEDVDPELILQAKIALARLEQAGGQNVIEGDILKIETTKESEG